MAANDAVLMGSFTSDGSAHLLDTQTEIDYILVKNRTQQATTANPGVGVQFEWFSTMAADSAYMVSKENTANTVTYELITSGGIQRIDQTNLSSATAVGGSISSITAADPAVVTTGSAHGLSVSDIVRPVETTAMRQIAGIPFSVTAVGSSTTATLGYLDASGFAAAATDGTLYLLPAENYFQPKVRYITAVTTGTTTEIQFSVTHQFNVDQMLSLRVPDGWGAVELDNVTAEVIAINTTTNTVTLDYDSSSGVTAFAFPTDTVAAAGVSYPIAVPAGTTPGGSSDNAYVNNAQYVYKLAAGADSPAGQNSDVIDWIAYKKAAEIS